MTLDEFNATLSHSRPPETVQQSEESSAEWVHAYLHRREGDLSNAAYWYRRVGRTAPRMSLEEEWQYIAEMLLAQCNP